MTSKQNLRHTLHSAYHHPVLRTLQGSSVSISNTNLMYPLFVTDDREAIESIPAMPGIHRYGINKLVPGIKSYVQKGLCSVILFGVMSRMSKDKNATHADSAQNPVIQVLPMLKATYPQLLIACDVCLCPYTDHGHCGIINPDGSIDNKASIKRLSEVALAYARAGAHIVAPSDMMDGRVKAIKTVLHENGFGDRVALLSYSVKFASSFYGPFREAARSAPAYGDRKAYQLPPNSIGLAKRAVLRDVEEGADMLMVKPGLPYLDVLKMTKELCPEFPVFVYQVSGEYSMLMAGSTAGAVDLKNSVLEILMSFRRSGADCIITYFTPMVLDWIDMHKRNPCENNPIPIC